TLTTSGAAPAELYYTDTQGPGRPVVLIHGWPASEKSWQPVATALQQAGYRVIAYDRRGFGASSHAQSGYDYDTFAADLAALLNELDLVDAVLVGFSMGGGEVARYVADHGSGRITAAAFIAAITPALDADLPDNPDGGFTHEAASGMQAAMRSDAEAFLTQFLTNFYSVPTAGDSTLMVPEQQIIESLQVARQASPEALVRSIALWLTDFRTDLAALDVPTLVIHGDGDQIVPFEASGKRMPQYVGQAEVKLIEKGPHGLLASHPAEVARALLDFLA
ncbi:MAG: alpha/beta fold hydrolase, partial [Brooklawnia sp.]